jgi:hypothetical protein
MNFLMPARQSTYCVGINITLSDASTQPDIRDREQITPRRHNRPKLSHHTQRRHAPPISPPIISPPPSHPLKRSRNHLLHHPRTRRDHHLPHQRHPRPRHSRRHPRPPRRLYWKRMHHDCLCLTILGGKPSVWVALTVSEYCGG